MRKKIISLSINSYQQSNEVIEILKKFKIKPVLHIKNYLIKGLGIDWLLTLRKLLEKNHSNTSFKFFVDAGYDYGLSILLANNKVNFIKLNSNPIIINKITEITNKNRVLLNPCFDVVDLSNIKNLQKKLIKIYLKEKNED